MTALPWSPSPDGARADTYILVVDDDPAIGEVVCEVLGGEGYSVDWASNGALALARVERGVPRLILLDMRMPVLDGWGFARGLNERGIRAPIVVMTATRNAQQWADEINADGCLPKPFDLEDLLGIVRQFVGTGV